MKRNRIVIDFDPAQPQRGAKETPRAGAGPGPAARRSRVGWVLGIIAIIFVVFVIGIAAGAYFWWQHFESTPAYSLAVLADAAQRDDTATIDSVLDSDKIADDFVSQVRQRISNSYSSAIPSVLTGQIDSAVAALTPKLKPTVHDEVVREIKRLTAPAAGKPLFLIALAVSQFADIKQENNIAHVLVNIKDEQFQLTMQPDAGRWRVTAVQDDKLAQRIADSVLRNLPSSGTQLQDEVRKQLNKLKNLAP
jgi:hypothetical protein